MASAWRERSGVLAEDWETAEMAGHSMTQRARLFCSISILAEEGKVKHTSIYRGCGLGGRSGQSGRSGPCGRFLALLVSLAGVLANAVEAFREAAFALERGSLRSKLPVEQAASYSDQDQGGVGGKLGE